MDDAPEMAPYGRHVLMCTGEYCDPERRAGALYQQLATLLGDLGRYDNPERVKRGTTPCLGVCMGGPILAVYPEGVWYHHVDEALLERVVEEHLKERRPVEEWVFHRLEPEDEEAGDGIQA